MGGWDGQVVADEGAVVIQVLQMGTGGGLAAEESGHKARQSPEEGGTALGVGAIVFHVLLRR